MKSASKENELIHSREAKLKWEVENRSLFRKYAEVAEMAGNWKARHPQHVD
jgi:hypothetical protein